MTSAPLRGYTWADVVASYLHDAARYDFDILRTLMP